MKPYLLIDEPISHTKENEIFINALKKRLNDYKGEGIVIESKLDSNYNNQPEKYEAQN